MKAWCASDNNGEYGTQIIFAETRGKAHAIAMHEDVFEDCVWTDVRVRRFKEYDKYYTGEPVVDFWHDDEHRVRLVRDFGWTCIEYLATDCDDCPARQWCKGDADDLFY